LLSDISSAGGEAGSDVGDRRPTVTDASDIRQRIDEAGNLADVLDASYEAFETMLTTIDGYHDAGGPFYAGLVMAAAAAADGRDMLLSAPSLPPPSRDDVHADKSSPGTGRSGVVAHAGGDSVGAAAIVAALSRSVAFSLRQAAAKADAAGDRAACLDAARFADEVLLLSRGDEP
jgi:hypothetical protein